MLIGKVEAQLEKSPDRLLVLGVDGSGKSTWLGALATIGYEILEPTSSSRAREFRKRTATQVLDAEMIAEREDIYIDLNSDFKNLAEAKYSEGRKIATSGGELVTRVSHAVMRQTITSELSHRHHLDVAHKWIEAADQLPDSINLVHAPFSVISQRIAERQKTDTFENFWGFNSLVFLERYQRAWHEIISILEIETDVSCTKFDTDELTSAEMLSKFIESI
ncbi:TPA: hypothetical protein EYO12_01055 [Candidatus Saccharibacteria bacterium]|nr:hypothetical protein [Candidatus Saccharibacteria bacterium]HIO87306.1 hypothetical protein [Candidatus Saccharibacteria bacterium]